ncbi:MAG: pentapeptide repeat-containing protein [Bacteroidetes bacterium]|nr:pentapeptide repeat-containing protein [Bacteroidota bacterium]
MQLETYQVGKTYTNLVFAGNTYERREFDGCEFVSCDLSNVSFTTSTFSNCTFRQCNLSMVKFKKTGLSEIAFEGCKLMGADFSTANDFTLSMRFSGCILDYATFAGKPLKKTIFKECRLNEVNFTGADLAQAVFQQCDMSRAQFNRTNLTGADLVSSYGLSIDPEINTLKNAKISLHALPGLLERHQLRIEE